MTTADNREVVRCKSCGLVQFKVNACRRCHALFVPPPPKPAPLPETVSVETPSVSKCSVIEIIPLVVLLLRHARGYSQRDLARIMGAPRTYISKLENGGLTPNIYSVKRFAVSLDVPLSVLIRMCEVAKGVEA